MVQGPVVRAVAPPPSSSQCSDTLLLHDQKGRTPGKRASRRDKCASCRGTAVVPSRHELSGRSRNTGAVGPLQTMEGHSERKRNPRKNQNGSMSLNEIIHTTGWMEDKSKSQRVKSKLHEKSQRTRRSFKPKLTRPGIRLHCQTIDLDIFVSKSSCLRRPPCLKCSKTTRRCFRKPVMAGGLEHEIPHIGREKHFSRKLW